MCSGPVSQCWVGLPLAALGPNVLSKGVGTDPIAAYFGPDCAQTIPHLPGFYHRSMVAELLRESYGGTHTSAICITTCNILPQSVGHSVNWCTVGSKKRF